MESVFIVMWLLCVNRLVLRCRQLARSKFASMRSDALVKMELLDQKHGMQLQSFDFSHPLVNTSVLNVVLFLFRLPTG